MARLRVGTSGWSYREWRGLVYPARLPSSRWLAHYTGLFDTVEVNASFYRLLKRSDTRQWRQATAPWAAWLRQQIRRGRDAYVFFDNSAEGDAAVRNAEIPRAMVQGKKKTSAPARPSLRLPIQAREAEQAHPASR